MSALHDILLIDRHNRDRAVFAAMLTGYGYHVQEARTLAEAQAALQSGYTPHMIILDTEPADASVAAFLSLTQPTTRIILLGSAEYASSVQEHSRYEYVSRQIQPTELLNCIV
jgi:DNA-binding NtrC family response regulator